MESNFIKMEGRKEPRSPLICWNYLSKIFNLWLNSKMDLLQINQRPLSKKLVESISLVALQLWRCTLIIVKILRWKDVSKADSQWLIISQWWSSPKEELHLFKSSFVRTVVFLKDKLLHKWTIMMTWNVREREGRMKKLRNTWKIRIIWSPIKLYRG